MVPIENNLLNFIVFFVIILYSSFFTRPAPASTCTCCRAARTYSRRRSTDDESRDKRIIKHFFFSLFLLGCSYPFILFLLLSQLSTLMDESLDSAGEADYRPVKIDEIESRLAQAMNSLSIDERTKSSRMYMGSPPIPLLKHQSSSLISFKHLTWRYQRLSRKSMKSPIGSRKNTLRIQTSD